MAFVDRTSVVAYFTIQDIKKQYVDIFTAEYTVDKAFIVKALDADAYMVYTFASMCILVINNKNHLFKLTHKGLDTANYPQR